MAEYNEVYQRARYYDIAFRRDITREVDFLFELYQRHAGKPLESMIDIACGPGYHAIQFAEKGVRTYGLDLRPEMIDFGKELAGPTASKIKWMAQDMRTYMLDKPVDLALNSYDSMDCLLTNDDIVAHFKAVARNLTPNGLYVFEMTHPRDCSIYDYGDFTYKGTKDGVSVQIQWIQGGGSILDMENQVRELEVTMTVNDHGKEMKFVDRARERFSLPQEYVALAKLSGALEVTRFYGDFRFDQPFDMTPGARRMIVVLKKV
jgi:SAM-dependent methyltransferase